ncbi:MAG: hypothetical protein H8D94_00225, partial [Candidatus Pelagibacter sp.]|nr:hypothetical protein [Candidatus Pelagibacter sp.]
MGLEVYYWELYIYQRYGHIYPYVSKYYGGIGNIVINEESSQNWIGYCEDRTQLTKDACEIASSNWIYPYYPVVPKINKLGKFDEDLCLQNGILLADGH